MRQGERIDRMEVFEYHKWVCHICGKTIDRTLRLPNRMAATLDHLLPFACGGQHIFKNVAPAHDLCNTLKADSVDPRFGAYGLLQNGSGTLEYP